MKIYLSCNKAIGGNDWECLSCGWVPVEHGGIHLLASNIFERFWD